MDIQFSSRLSLICGAWEMSSKYFLENIPFLIWIYNCQNKTLQAYLTLYCCSDSLIWAWDSIAQFTCYVLLREALSYYTLLKMVYII